MDKRLLIGGYGLTANREPLFQSSTCVRNLTTFLPGIVIISLVLRLIVRLSLRSFTINEPKPRRNTSSFFFNVSVTISSTEFKKSLLWANVSPVFCESLFTSCFLFISTRFSSITNSKIHCLMSVRILLLQQWEKVQHKRTGQKST